MVRELKLGAKDFVEYGGPEWLRFEPEALADMSYDELEALEQPMRAEDGMTLNRMLSWDWMVKSLPGVRAAFWVARQLAGLPEPGYADFKPNPLACTWREAADALPPADGSSEPPSATTRSKKASTS